MAGSRAKRAMGMLVGAALASLLFGLVPSEAMRERSLARLAAQRPELAAGVFLVATRNLRDPRFSESVILLTQYDAGGVMGIIINRPTRHRLADLLPDIEALEGRSDPLFFGGPVSVDAIVMLLRSSDDVALAHTRRVFGNVYFTGNPEAFSYILGRRKEGEAIRGYAGYAGWAPGQLEAEIARGDWTLSAANAATVFREDPSDVWKSLAPEPDAKRELRASR